MIKPWEMAVSQGFSCSDFKSIKVLKYRKFMIYTIKVENKP